MTEAYSGQIYRASYVRALTPPWVTLHRTTSLTIANTTNSTITWDGIDDASSNAVASEWWDVAQPTRILIEESCSHQVLVQMPWASNGTGIRTVWLTINGSIPRLWEEPFVPSATATLNGHSLSWRGPLTSGDYLEVLCWQNSGGGLSVTSQVPVRCTITRHSQ